MKNKRILFTLVALLVVAGVGFSFYLKNDSSASNNQTGNDSNSVSLSINNQRVKADASVSEADVIDASKHNGTSAAKLINKISDQDKYENCVRKVLNSYYGDEKASKSKIDAFYNALDNRGDLIKSNYKEAAAERSNADNLNYQTKKVIVTFKEDVTASKAKSILSDSGFTYKDTEPIEAGDPVLIDLPLEYSAKTGSSKLVKNEQVDIAQPNYKYSLSEDEETTPDTVNQENQTSEDSKASEDDKTSEKELKTEKEVNQTKENKEEITEDASTKSIPNEIKSGGDNLLWHLDYINAFAAWDKLPSSKAKVNVAVIDTGVQADHPDLQGVIDNSKCAIVESGKDPVVPLKMTDPHGHGTHVSGIIAAKANNAKTYNNSCSSAGVASGYSTVTGNDNNIVNLFVIDSMTGNNGYSIDIANSIKYAKKQHAQVINLSLGGPGTDPLISNAMKDAADSGILCVCASGNENTDAMVSPADSYEAISVSNSTKNGSLSPSSNYGYQSDVKAPGTSVWSTVPSSGFGSKSGTSMASPVVAGEAAMVYYCDPSISLRQAKNIIYASTDSNVFSYKGGFGEVNALSAVEAATSLTSVAPTSIIFNRNTAVGYVGDEITIEYKVEPENTTNVNASWTSDNPSVATVNNGVVKGNKAGQARITATVGGVSTSCNITIKEKYQTINAKTLSETSSINIDSPVSTALVDPELDSNITTGAYMKGYKYNASAGETFMLLAGSDDFSVYVKMYNSSGELVAANNVNNGDKNKSGIKYTSTKAETYYIEVTQNVLYDDKLERGDVDVVFASSGIEFDYTLIGYGYNGAKITIKPTKGITSYGIYRYDAAKKKYVLRKTQSSTTFIDSGLICGNTYKYKVTAFVNRNDLSIKIGDVFKSATPYPNRVAFYYISRGHKAAHLKWKRTPGANGYYIYMATSKTGKYTVYKHIPNGSTLYYKSTGLKPGKYYYYKLRAYRTVNGKKVFNRKYSDILGVKAIK